MIGAVGGFAAVMGLGCFASSLSAFPWFVELSVWGRLRRLIVRFLLENHIAMCLLRGN
jgi:hypothetical protein